MQLVFSGRANGKGEAVGGCPVNAQKLVRKCFLTK